MDMAWVATEQGALAASLPTGGAAQLGAPAAPTPRGGAAQLAARVTGHRSQPLTETPQPLAVRHRLAPKHVGHADGLARGPVAVPSTRLTAKVPAATRAPAGGAAAQPEAHAAATGCTPGPPLVLDDHGNRRAGGTVTITDSTARGPACRETSCYRQRSIHGHVSVTATPDGTHTFSSWTGACTGTAMQLVPPHRGTNPSPRTSPPTRSGDVHRAATRPAGAGTSPRRTSSATAACAANSCTVDAGRQP